MNNRRKVLLIGDSIIADAPYIKSYIDVFEKYQIPYDLVFWNRYLDDMSSLPENYIPYNVYTNNFYPNWKKMLKIYGFYRFVKKILEKREYAYVVIFTIAHAVFFEKYLIKNYCGRYVFDIRDYSPMYAISFLRKRVENLIAKSAFTVVSSKGFLRWLPVVFRDKYRISHNVVSYNIDGYLNYSLLLQEKKTIKILTIGQIRDKVSNSCIIQSFLNDKNYNLIFAGSGIAVEALQKFAVKKCAKNVVFTGRYIKQEENTIVENSDMMNIFFSHDINSDTLMSNRFYLSVMFRKPMIVNSGCYQAELVEKFNIGVIVNKNEDVKEAVEKYWKKFNYEIYNDGCVRFLKEAKEEMAALDMDVVCLYNKE